ncbi:MAG: hypothetical protein LBC44_02910, partial [Mycoplasmataceae bacterium]|nr:hypothetical protein [Mycoplasmataceae bacterium]
MFNRKYMQGLINVNNPHAFFPAFTIRVPDSVWDVLSSDADSAYSQVQQMQNLSNFGAPIPYRYIVTTFAPTRFQVSY